MIQADFSKLDRMLKKLMPMLDGLVAEYGWLSGAQKYKDGVAVAKVAGIQEARTGFFTKAVEEFLTSNSEEFADVAREVIAETVTPEAGVQRLVRLAGQSVMRAVEAEGLVDTGKMRDNVRWRVKGKGVKSVTGKVDP